MNIHDRRIQHKKNKARRNLEARLTHYAHNNIVMHLGITEYIHRFCRDKYGRINPDNYIENYIERYGDKKREIVE